MNPSLRRALHECVDIIFDALEEDARGAPIRKRRGQRIHEMPENISETTMKRAEAAAKKAGWT